MQASKTCLVRSNHPLALDLIKEVLCCDPALRPRIRLHSNSNDRPLSGTHDQILILDTCSVEDWAIALEKWYASGGTTITLVSSDRYSIELELQMLYHGAAGVVSFGDSLMDRLPKAVHVVAGGRLWIRREVLSCYVKRTADMLRKISDSDHRLTARENQVIGLLKQKLPTRTIAGRLIISERTVKFHVSNILRKLNLTSRRQLRTLDWSPNLNCPHWLLRSSVGASGMSLAIQKDTEESSGENAFQRSL